MNKANFHFYIILCVLILSFNIVNGLSAQTSPDDNPVGDLSVKMIIESLPDNVLLPTTDSTIFINLYRDCETRQGAFREGTFFIDTSKAFIMASFENIPYGKYCLIYKILRFGIEKETKKTFELLSDSTFTVLIKPKTSYDVMVAADPEQYSLYGGYLKSRNKMEPGEYSLVGESDMMNGRIIFTIVGRKWWKIKLGLENTDGDQFTVFDYKFSINSFINSGSHIDEDTSDTAAFEWIRVNKVK